MSQISTGSQMDAIRISQTYFHISVFIGPKNGECFGLSVMDVQRISICGGSRAQIVLMHEMHENLLGGHNIPT